MSIKEKRRIILISMIGVVAFILIMIGISYAYTMFSVDQKNPNVVQVGCLRVTLEEKNNISLSNSVPMSDNEGKKLTPYEFTIKNTCNIDALYETAFVVDNVTNESNIGNVKVYLTGDTLVEPKVLNTFNKVELTKVTTSNNFKIDEGMLNAGKEKTFYLNLWIDYDTTVSGWNFDGHVVLTSTTTTISDKTDPIVTFTNDGDGTLNVLATDESGLSSVCINKSSTTSDCYWNRYVDNFKYEITNTTKETYYAHVRDIYGNVTTSSIEGFIDGTAPVITLVNKTCAKGTCTLNVKMVDDVGVVAYQEGTSSSATSSWTTIDSIKEKTITLTKTTKGTYYVFAKDKKNNTGSLAIQITEDDLYIDTEKPILTVLSKGCDANKVCTVKVKLTDNIGVASYQEGSSSTAGTSWTSLSSATTETTITLTKSTLGTYYVFAKDTSENVGSVSYTLTENDYDQTPPVITFTIDDATHKIATATCTDPESGITGTATKNQTLTGTSNVDVTFTCTNGVGLSTTETKTYKYSTCALGENTCQSRTWNCSDCYYGENTCQSKYVCTQYSCPSGYSASGSSCTKSTTIAVGSYSSASACSSLCSREYGTGSYCSGSTCYNTSTQTASKVCSAGYTDDCYSGSNTCSYGCDYDSCYTGHNTCKVGWTL